MPKLFSEQVKAITNDFREEVYQDAKKSVKSVSSDTAKMLRQTSPKSSGSLRAGQYARGWTSRVEDKEGVVYNQTDWQLTHLLADGHRKFNRFGGPYSGTARSNDHIDKASEWAGNELPIRFSRGLK